MNLLRNVLILLLISLFSNSGFSQKDTLFWFVAPEVSSGAGDSPVFLRFLSYDNPATITINQPANGGFVPIVVNLPANSVDSVNLTPFLAQIEMVAANLVSNTGLKIVSTNEISAFYELRTGSNKETFSLKGDKALGTNFYTPFQKFWNNAVTTPASFSSIDIVATQNATTVLITPRTAIVGHAANVTYSITLNEGQTYSARDMSVSAATSLAGSIISSNNPIAITVFDGSLSNGACSDAAGDQITHAGVIGTDHIIHKGTGSTDRVYVLATQNGTSVTLYNSTTTSTLINWSETYEIALTENVNYIKTTKPVYVMHVSGYGCDLSAAQVPNVFCAGTYSTSFTRSSSDSLGLVLYTRTGFENQFTLNGNPSLISPAAFATVPGTSGEFKVAYIHFSTTDVPVNSYNIVENTGDVFGLGVQNGNASNGAGYAYYSNFNSFPFVSAGVNDTVCANVSLPINGIVGGGSVTGIWSTTGYGIFQNGNSTLSNNYVPSPLDTLISPIQLILTSTGPCPVQKDTLTLVVNPSPLVNASADQTLCTNNAIVNLNGAVSGGASTGIWSSLGTGTFNPDATTLNATYVPSAADVTTGSVILVLTSTNNANCNVSTDTMEVLFTGAAIVTASVDTISVCSNNPLVNLSGTVSGSSTTGKWVTAGNGIYSPNNLSLIASYSPSTTEISNGQIWMYLESTQNGNCNPVRDSILIIFTPSPTVEAGINQIVCSNDVSTILSGSVGGATLTGVWSGGAGTYSPNSTDLNATYTPSISEVSAGFVVLTLTSTNNGGCNAVADLFQINFVAPPFANFNGMDVCVDNLTSFTDFSLPGYGTISTWEWDFDDGNTSSTQNTSNLYAGPGVYTVELITTTNVGCSDTVTKQVEVFANPIASFTYEASCPNNQVVIDFADNSTSTDVIDYWFYDFGGQGTVATQNATQLFTSNGNYTITHIIETVNGCKDTVTEVINIPAIPEAGFYYNSSNGSNVGAIFNFVDTSNYGNSYVWQFGNSTSSMLQNPSNTYFANGNYQVTQYVYGALGCYDSTSTWITINTVTIEINTLIPNMISPNGDGKNDVWKLEFIGLLFPQATVEIYNQWGQQLFYSEGYTTPWDGTYNDELVPDGNYFYVITLNAGLETDQYKGALLVLKSRK